MLCGEYPPGGRDGLAPVTVLRGPRQVGKATLQEQPIDYLLRQGGDVVYPRIASTDLDV
jgi:predicted AAA+ superfamily ATPase